MQPTGWAQAATITNHRAEHQIRIRLATRVEEKTAGHGVGSHHLICGCTCDRWAVPIDGVPVEKVLIWHRAHVDTPTGRSASQSRG